MASLSIFEILSKGKNKNKVFTFYKLSKLSWKKMNLKVTNKTWIPNLHLIWFNSSEEPLKQGKQLLQEKNYLHKAKFSDFHNWHKSKLF